MFSFAEDVCFRSKDEKCNTSTKRRSYKQLIFFIQSPIRLDHLTRTMCGNYMFGVLKKRVWEILNNFKSSFNYNQWLSWYRKNYQGETHRSLLFHFSFKSTDCHWFSQNSSLEPRVYHLLLEPKASPPKKLKDFIR